MIQYFSLSESILSKSFGEIYVKDDYIKLDDHNHKDFGLANFHYCSTKSLKGIYSFLGYPVDKLAVKIDSTNALKEVVLIIETYDDTTFYQKMVAKYGLPGSSRLSAYFIEKNGFKVPTEIMRDTLPQYYENLPKPKIAEFGELQNVVWFDVQKSPANTLAHIEVRNKTNPSNKFRKKEIWVFLRKAK